VQEVLKGHHIQGLVAADILSRGSPEDDEEEEQEDDQEEEDGESEAKEKAIRNERRPALAASCEKLKSVP
jgi:hypothetical protein